MLIVTGATGHLGGGVVDRLLQLVAPDRVAVSVRDPAKATALSERGVRVRRGDYAEPATLATAFEGAEAVLVVSGSALGEEGVRHHRAAFEAARDAGAERILYTSHQAASPSSTFAAAPDHAASEAALDDLGVPFVSLRNGFHANTVPMLMGGALERGEIVAPEDGPVSWTARPDLAEVAALTLAGRSGLDGRSPALTAAEALDLAAVAAIASDLAGREIRRVTVTDAAYKATLVGRGTPDHVADLLVGMFVAARAGEFDVVDPALEQIVGHAPTPLRDVIAASVAGA